MRLHAWRTVWRDIEFDPDTGASQIVKLPEPRDSALPVCGFADVAHSIFGRRVTFALYLQESELFFNADARKWHLSDPHLSFSYRIWAARFVSTFSVFESGERTFSFSYPHLIRLVFARLDPTYDPIDFEHDFFLAFVAENAASSSWQGHIRERWPAGGLTRR